MFIARIWKTYYSYIILPFCALVSCRALCFAWDGVDWLRISMHRITSVIPLSFSFPLAPWLFEVIYKYKYYIIYIYVGFQTLDDSRLSSHSGTQCGIVNEPGVLVGFTYWFLHIPACSVQNCIILLCCMCCKKCVCVCLKIVYAPQNSH